jgi:AraC-like DNA-binding protein
MQQLWNVRLREGCRLLRQTGLSIAEVAYRVGFQTPYHFSRHVRQHAGMPPRAYRQSHWEQPGAKPSNDMSG